MMNEEPLSVRKVDKKVFKEFKAEATKEGLPVGVALTMAMETWLEKKDRKKQKFLEVKPWSWGKGTEKTSSEVDKILYG